MLWPRVPLIQIERILHNFIKMQTVFSVNHQYSRCLPAPIFCTIQKLPEQASGRLQAVFHHVILSLFLVPHDNFVQGLCKLRVSVGDNIIHSWFVRRENFAHDMRGCCFCLCGRCESECADLLTSSELYRWLAVAAGCGQLHAVCRMLATQHRESYYLQHPIAWANGSAGVLWCGFSMCVWECELQ